MQGSLFACLCLWWTVVLPWCQNTQQWSVGSLLVCGPKIEVVPLSQLPSFIAVDALKPSTARHRCLSLQTEAGESCARLPASLHFKPVQTPHLSPPESLRFVCFSGLLFLLFTQVHQFISTFQIYEFLLKRTNSGSVMISVTLTVHQFIEYG